MFLFQKPNFYVGCLSEKKRRKIFNKDYALSSPWSQVDNIVINIKITDNGEIDIKVDKQNR